MVETLTLFLVVFAAMTFIVVLIRLVIDLIVFMSNKKK